MSDGCCCCVCVTETDAAIIEYFGKFTRVAPAGFQCLVWPCESIVKTISLRIQYMMVDCETKTKDNVFVRIAVGVQYRVMEDKVPSAYYKLTDSKRQIKSYVYDVVRGCVPKMELDQTFASKDTIANAVKDQLQHAMSEFGYEIVAALVTDIDPNINVKHAMNEIVASQRGREAAAERAEAEKILQVKAAEAEGESKYLRGVGVAKERQAIVEGLRDSVQGFSHDVQGASAADVMDLLLVTQYFDMLKDLGRNKPNNTLFLPHGPKSVSILRDELKAGFMVGLHPPARTSGK